MLNKKSNRAGEHVAIGSALLVSVVGLTVLIGWWLEIGFLKSDFSKSISTMPNTALCLILDSAAILLVVSFGVLAATTVTGLPGLIKSKGLASKFLPLAIVLPILFGWLHLVGQTSSSLEGEFGVALFVSFAIVFNSALVCWAAAERNYLERSLQASERRYRAIVEATPQVIWSVGGESSAALSWWTSLTGQSEEEAAGWGWLDCVHPEDRERVRAGWAQAYVELTKYETQYRIRSRTGEYRHIDVRGIPILNQNGKLEEWVGTLTDDTESFNAKSALIESDQRFRQLADSMPQIVWASRADGQVDYFNRKWFEATGSTGDLSWILFLYPKDRQKYLDTWKEAVQTGHPFAMEIRLRFPADAAFRWYLSRALPVRGKEGQIVRWYGTYTDIHEQKMAEEQLRELNENLERRVSERTSAWRESEERFRLIVEQIEDYAIFMLDPQGLVLTWNVGAQRLKQYYAHEIIGHHFSRFYPPELLESRWPERGLKLAQLEGKNIDEGWRVRKDGSRFWAEVIINAIRDDYGNLIGYSKITRDLTASRAAEQAIQESEERLKLALENSQQGLWDWHVTTGRAYLDNRWQEMLGYNPGELPHRIESWERTVHPDDLPRVMKVLAKHLQSEASLYDVEYRGLTKSGGSIWINARGSVQERSPTGTALRMTGTVQDITVRKDAEHHLAASEALLRQFIAHAPAAIAILDTEMRYLRVSTRWLTDYNLDDQNLIGQSHYEVFPEISNRWKEIHRRVLDGTIETCEEDQFKRADGSIEWVQWEAHPWHLPSGKIGGLILFAQVVTGRKRIEESLREALAFNRGVLDSLSAHIAVVDRSGTITRINRAWEEFTQEHLMSEGILARSGLGTSYLAVCDRSARGSCNEALHAGDGIRNVLAGTEPGFRLEYECRTPKENLWFSMNVTPLGTSSGGAVISHTNVTDRKRAEESLRISETQYRSVVDSLAEGVVVQDAEGAILSSNQRACEILGLTREQIAGRKSIDPKWQAVHEDGSPFPGEEHPTMVTLKTGQPLLNVVMGVMRPSGEQTWMMINSVPILQTTGSSAAVVASFHDITESRMLYERIKSSLREKEVLLKEIHHRVKNNLQIVSSLLDLQSSHTNDPSALGMFQECRGRVKSMALIHERLYRSEDIARVNFSDYVRHLVADLSHAYRITEDEIRLELAIDIPPLPIDIAIPCGLLLNELLSNCFKYAFNGTEGVVRIEFHKIEEKNIIIVSDNGSGFPIDLDFRNTASFGLQLVNTLVDQLHGEIDLVAEQGTTFTIQFPKTKKITSQ